MARSPDRRKREALREAVADDLIAHGLGDVSLRPMAARLGTSARMLLHYFGSREALIAEALAAVRAREDGQIQAWLAERPGRPTLREFLTWYWVRTADPATAPLLMLLLEIYVLALRAPDQFPGAIESPLSYWRDVVLPQAEDDEALATVVLAFFRGLLIDVAGTGDRARIARGLDLFLRLLERAAPSGKPG